ncbi:hypothetical protein BJV82DRAFT_576799 [Fennellomyces sp. T-0311]|nr:hypothetical protein BJV82DRAFT_576799 [Fennellomyces sp. T-0311]
MTIEKLAGYLFPPNPSNSIGERNMQQAEHHGQHSSVESQGPSKEDVLAYLEDRVHMLSRLSVEYNNSAAVEQDQVVSSRITLPLTPIFLNDPRRTGRSIRKKDIRDAIKSLSNHRVAKDIYTFLRHCTTTAVARMTTLVAASYVLLPWELQDEGLRIYTMTWFLVAARVHHPSIPLDRCQNLWISSYLVTNEWNRAAAQERNKIERRSLRAHYVAASGSTNTSRSTRNDAPIMTAERSNR